MDTVIVKNSQFYSHCQKRIAKGTVNAEHVEIRLDSEWDGLTVRIHWLNVASKVEKNPLLERDKPNTIPWEVLTDLGELRMGLVGLDGETVIKPTIWLTYGYVGEGVDPESGSDPQPPTPSWEQQMVEQATAAANAAKAAKETADNLQAAAEAGEFDGDPGPVGPPGKSPIIRNGTWWIWDVEAQDYRDTGVVASGGGGGGTTDYNKLTNRPSINGTTLAGNLTAQQLGLATSGELEQAVTDTNQAAQDAQDAALEAGKSKAAAQTSAQQAGTARDQANTAAYTAGVHAADAEAAKAAAERAATNAGASQTVAARSAQESADSAKAANQAKVEAEAAAAIIPPLSAEVANQFLAADEVGKSMRFVPAPSGGGVSPKLLVDYTTPEAVNYLYFSHSDDGTPFDMKRMRFFLFMPSNTGATQRGAWLRIDDGSKGDGPQYNYRVSVNSNTLAYGRLFEAKVELFDECPDVICRYSSGTAASALNSFSSYPYNNPIAKIGEVKFLFSDSSEILEGTRVLIWSY